MLKKCTNCGKFFGDDDQTLCSDCRNPNRKFKTTGDISRDKFLAARDIVYDNPDISPQGIVDLMEEMGIEISVREILKYVDEGRLSLNVSKEGNHCLRCGTRIPLGKYCDRCRIKMEAERKNEDSRDSDDDYKRRVKMHISK